MSVVIAGFEFISVQGAYFVSTFLLVVFLYSYILYLYKSQSDGSVDYEKYGRLALDDSLDDDLIEVRKPGREGGS